VEHWVDGDAADPGVGVLVGVRCLDVDLELPLDEL
jgi:hypothetical protein